MSTQQRPSSVTDSSPSAGSKRRQQSQQLGGPRNKRSCTCGLDHWEEAGADYYEPDWEEVQVDWEEAHGEVADWDEEEELRAIWEDMYCGEEGYEVDDGYWGYGGACAEGDFEWEEGPEEGSEFEDVSDSDEGSEPAGQSGAEEASEALGCIQAAGAAAAP